LKAVPDLRWRTALVTIYAAGLRVSEAVALTIKDIDSARMVIHIRQAKGGKGRHVMLSEQLLGILRDYWKRERPQHWLFPGPDTGSLLRWGNRTRWRAWIVREGPYRGEAHNYSMEVRSDPFESAKSHFFDTSSWGEFCDVTLTLKQAWQPDRGGWLKIDDYRCRQAFRHFMNLLNRAVYGSAFRRHGKRLRVLPVLEKGEVRARALRPWECGASGRWHIHCAIELPSHFDAITLEKMIRECWAKVEWGHGRILVRDGANAGWIDYMLKDRQKSEFDGFLDCIIIESLHNPIADA